MDTISNDGIVHSRTVRRIDNKNFNSKNPLKRIWSRRTSYRSNPNISKWNVPRNNSSIAKHLRKGIKSVRGAMGQVAHSVRTMSKRIPNAIIGAARGARAGGARGRIGGSLRGIATGIELGANALVSMAVGKNPLNAEARYTNYMKLTSQTKFNMNETRLKDGRKYIKGRNDQRTGFLPHSPKHIR